jgi:hypothetical protein
VCLPDGEGGPLQRAWLRGGVRGGVRPGDCARAGKVAVGSDVEFEGQEKATQTKEIGMSDINWISSITEAQNSVREHLRRPVAKKGVHDWSANCTKVDELEGGDPHTFGNLLTAFGLGVLAIFLVFCAVLGALLLARAVHDAVTFGWSWRVIGESLRDRLGPA